MFPHLGMQVDLFCQVFLPLECFRSKKKTSLVLETNRTLRSITLKKKTQTIRLCNKVWCQTTSYSLDVHKHGKYTSLPNSAT